MAAAPDVESLAKEARRAFRHRKLDEAIDLFNQALAQDEKRHDLHMSLATVYFLAKNYDSAVKHFTRVSQLAPTDGKSLINLGAVYNQMSDYNKAVSTLRRGLQKERASAEGYYNLGYAHRKLGQFAMAVSAYREAIRIEPEMVDGHVNLANVYVEMKNVQQAILHYKKALELNPQHESALRGLEVAENNRSVAKKAISPFGRLVEQGTMRAKTTAKAGRQLTDAERIDDRKKVFNLCAEVDHAARRYLQHLQDVLEPRLSALNRGIAQGPEGNFTLSKLYDDYQAAITDALEMRRTFKRKTLELRSHEELISTPELRQDSADS